jgi:hypothetical protein
MLSIGIDVRFVAKSDPFLVSYVACKVHQEERYEAQNQPCEGGARRELHPRLDRGRGCNRACGLARGGVLSTAPHSGGCSPTRRVLRRQGAFLLRPLSRGRSVLRRGGPPFFTRIVVLGFGQLQALQERGEGPRSLPC